MKAGYKTTEFWLTLLVALPAAINTFMLAIDGQELSWKVVIGAIPISIYALARAFVKAQEEKRRKYEPAQNQRVETRQSL